MRFKYLIFTFLSILCFQVGALGGDKAFNAAEAKLDSILAQLKLVEEAHEINTEKIPKKLYMAGYDELDDSEAQIMLKKP